jgi:hypothetical protein
MRKFMAGILTCAGVTGLVADFMGKEAWLKATASGWVDASVSIPTELLGLLLASYWFFHAPKQR